ncbi:hypothetical protein GUITHDRAFT_142155 [Guillardia theta CCMP2712]|uniref:Uncharacterized protein n=2 Tax=Guillardia theta TaxID=55529 RepID=L1IYB6_GUITC|nr:hypothetical protein GUITHDRAFT_142155 [Guillardia theta CCMP2712]EKX41236.1 hypothetical protein GUITHDRAFT_142155 [Guillardia theta CCMP2712]|eukprot:XP_005828216.1 hypothetical protein GUITHDRAFT_142155 [Guillardia theta CCMP2712]
MSGEAGKRPPPPSPLERSNSVGQIQAKRPASGAAPPASGNAVTVAALAAQMQDAKRTRDHQNQRQTAMQAMNAKKCTLYEMYNFNGFDNVQIVPCLPSAKPKEQVQK